VGTVSVTVTDRSGGTAQASVNYAVGTPATKPLMGASTSSNTTWSTLTNAIGQFQARRTYEGGGSTLPSSFSSSRASSDPANGRVTYSTFKPNQDGGLINFPNSAIQQNWLRSFLRSVPVGHRYNIGVFHEPEDNIANGEFTLAQWKATVNKVGQIVHEIRAEQGPNSRLRNGFCIMGPWTFDSTSPYDTWDWSGGIDWSVIDYVAIDAYIWNGNDPSYQRQMTYDDMGRGNGQTRACMTKLLQWGKPVALTEWGVTSNDQTDQEKADEMRAAWAWMKSWNVAHPELPIEAALYFHYNLEADVTWEVLGAGEELAKQALIDILADAKK
jgi:hypothetical protein